MTPEQNELLTRVDNQAPMGQMLRENFWFPFSRSVAIQQGDAPLRVRLLGEPYVAFRGEDGRIGFLDEACPHRRASLALGRVEGCGIRCIFHGWKVDASGEVVEIPSEAARNVDPAHALKVQARHYPIFENGGLVWVWLGESEPAPKPNLPFFDLTEKGVWITRTIANCNWLQGVETTLDSVHVGTLHQSWIKEFAEKNGGTIGNALAAHPLYEVQDTDYGFRAAAIRKIADDKRYLRVTEYAMPFVSIVPGVKDAEGTIFISVPIDDTHHLHFFGQYNRFGDAMVPGVGLVNENVEFDLDNFAAFDGDETNRWGQNREVMEQGHFTGFTRTLLQEDMVVQQSMGPITDRSKEVLCSSDVAIAHLRKFLLEKVKKFQEGQKPLADDVSMPRPIDSLVGSGFNWRSPDSVLPD